MTVHRARALLVSERTALVNHIRGLLSEYGVVVAQGVATLRKIVPEILQDAENGVPALAREVFAELYERLQGLDERLRAYDHRIAQLARSSEAAQRLMQTRRCRPVDRNRDRGHRGHRKALSQWAPVCRLARLSGPAALLGR